MVWIKTAAGRAEMQTRALVKERARRNLLLLVDGVRTDAMLLQQVAGVTPADLVELGSLGLIEQAQPSRTTAAAREAPAPPEPAAPEPAPAPVAAAPAGPQDYVTFTAALNQLIGDQLGLRGFTLVLAVEKASTPQELIEVAEKVIAAIRDRKGDAAADKARTTLFG